MQLTRVPEYLCDIPDNDGDDRKVEFLKYDVTSFAYYLKSTPKALVIGPGGGRDILTASIFGSEDITGVEVNPIIVNDVMRNRFKDYSGNIYERKNIHIVVDDARSFIKHSKEKYDIIQTSLVDTFAATNAGAYSLTENNLYTLEAITEYLKHLSHEGIFTIGVRGYWQLPHQQVIGTQNRGWAVDRTGSGSHRCFIIQFVHKFFVCVVNRIPGVGQDIYIYFTARHTGNLYGNAIPAWSTDNRYTVQKIDPLLLGS